jgi:hypothetical protein
MSRCTLTLDNPTLGREIISVAIRPAAQPPMVFALIFIDRQIANAGDARARFELALVL